jgi:hypothetical protein
LQILIIIRIQVKKNDWTQKLECLFLTKKHYNFTLFYSTDL